MSRRVMLRGTRPTKRSRRSVRSRSRTCHAIHPAQFLDKVVSVPLLHQPGAVWDYGFGLDVLGLVVEKISGQSLGQYLQTNLWTPLGMNDTGFYVPPEKAARYAKPLPTDPYRASRRALRRC